MSWSVSGHKSDPQPDHDEKVKAFFASVKEMALAAEIADEEHFFTSPQFPDDEGDGEAEA